MGVDSLTGDISSSHIFYAHRLSFCVSSCQNTHSVQVIRIIWRFLSSALNCSCRVRAWWDKPECRTLLARSCDGKITYGVDSTAPRYRPMYFI